MTQLVEVNQSHGFLHRSLKAAACSSCETDCLAALLTVLSCSCRSWSVCPTVCSGCCASRLWVSPISSSTLRTWACRSLASSSPPWLPKRSMCDVDSWLMCAWTRRSVTDTPQAWMCCGLVPPWLLCQVIQDRAHARHGQKYSQASASRAGKITY